MHPLAQQPRIERPVSNPMSADPMGDGASLHDEFGSHSSFKSYIVEDTVIAPKGRKERR